MKKRQIFTAVLLIIFVFSNCRKTEEQEVSEEKRTTDTLSSEKANELEGIVYREITEIPQLKEYEYQAGSMIYTEKDSDGDYKYGISQYGNDKNSLLVFKEIIKEGNNPKVKYKILDTLNIPQLNIDEHIAVCSCRLNKTADSEIIAVVKALSSDDVEFYDHIIKAWRADPKSKKIILIEDVKGIECINEGYDL